MKKPGVGLALSLLLALCGCSVLSPDKAEIGDSCTKDDDCEEELRCLTKPAPKFCTQFCGYDRPECPEGFVCVEHADWSCAAEADEGQGCRWNAQCVGDLVCNWALEPPVCVPPGDVGFPCLMDNECAVGLRCDEAAAPSACVPLGDVGEACATSAECVPGLSCIILPTLLGICAGPCQSSLDCPVGTQCVPEANYHCQAIKGLGTKCVWDSQCQDGLFCIPEADQPEVSTCQLPLVAGEQCWFDEHCIEGLICNGGLQLAVCQLPGDVGQPCAEDDDCQEELQCAIPDHVCE